MFYVDHFTFHLVFLTYKIIGIKLFVDAFIIKLKIN